MSVRKRLLVVAGVVVALALAAVVAFAAYCVTGSGTDKFTTGVASELVVQPNASGLNGVLPGDSVKLPVAVTNPNSRGVTVTGLTLAFDDGGACAFNYAVPDAFPFALGPGKTREVRVTVTMGDPAPGCEGAVIGVTATAEGTLP